jgi:hypothetical protein
MSAWTYRRCIGKAAQKIVCRVRSNIDIAVVDSLKALDPERPIREADVFLFFRVVWKPQES